MTHRKTSRRRSGPPRPPARPSGSEALDLLYGLHTVIEALANPRRRIRRLLVTRNALSRLEAAIARRGIAVEPVHSGELDRLTGPDAVHQGVVAEAESLAQPALAEIDSQGPVVVLDQVTDPHNVGAIVRSCAAFGVSALVTTARHSPALSGVLAKAASGALEHVPMIAVTNLARALGELKEAGYTVLGLDSEANEIIEAHARDRPVAIVLGAEGKGLRHLTRQTCDCLVRLDLPGPIRSLNVSNAAALALYALKS
jgi:23S rRNA (guanosine2251-2'-O)-methyltransferase